MLARYALSAGVVALLQGGCSEDCDTGAPDADPVDAFVGPWLQTEETIVQDCGWEDTEGATGFYNVFTKVDATTATVQACEDEACTKVLWDAGTWTVVEGGMETTFFNQSSPAFDGYDCTYHQVNVFECAASDDTCAWVLASDERMALWGTLALSWTGTECEEGAAANGQPTPHSCTLNDMTVMHRP